MWSTAWYLTPEDVPVKVATNTFGHDELQRANPDWRGPFPDYWGTVRARGGEAPHDELRETRAGVSDMECDCIPVNGVHSAACLSGSRNPCGYCARRGHGPWCGVLCICPAVDHYVRGAQQMIEESRGSKSPESTTTTEDTP